MNNKIHICGPFMSASNALHGLSENLYQQRLLTEAIDMYCEYERKLKEAIENEHSDEHIEMLKKESEYYDQIFELSIVNVVTLEEA